MATNTKERTLQIIHDMIEYMTENPLTKPSEVEKALNISRQTVWKHYKDCKKVIAGEIKRNEINNKYWRDRENLIQAVKENPFAYNNELAKVTGQSATNILKNINAVRNTIPFSTYQGKTYTTKSLKIVKVFAKFYQLLPSEEIDEILPTNFTASSRRYNGFSIGDLHGTYDAKNSIWNITIQ